MHGGHSIAEAFSGVHSLLDTIVVVCNDELLPSCPLSAGVCSKASLSSKETN